MRIVRWVLLLLYLALLVGLFGFGFYGSDDPWPLTILLSVTVASWAMFLLGAGRKQLCRPIRRPRLLLPVIAASFMLAFLVMALTLALTELFRIEEEGPEGPFVALAFLGIAWVFWGVVLFVYTRNLRRFQAILLMARLIFAGSLAELLASISSHLVVSKRPGCFVGIATMLGVLGGLLVMLWSFGPAIYLLFLKEAYRRERRCEESAESGSQPPRMPFQYRLSTIFIVMSVTGLISGMLRAFWGQWPAAAVAGWVILALAIPLLATNFWTQGAGLLGVLFGLVWLVWQEEAWSVLLLLVIPAVAFGLVLARLLFRRGPEDNEAA